MALLVPDIGELESLRYLINANNHVPSREDNAPRDLILKLYVSNTTPAEGDVPSQTAYFEPYNAAGTLGYGTAPVTNYPACINNRTETRYDYTDQYGILLNGSRWTIATSGGTTTASYPEQTFTFSGPAGNVYGYYIVRANNMPIDVQGVADAATAASATQITKGTQADPCIGVIGNNFITLPNVANVMDNVTNGMVVGGNTGVPANTVIQGVDRATRVIYLSNNLTANIEALTDPDITLDYSQVSTGANAHGLQPGDVIFIERGTGNTTTTAGTYVVHTTPSGTTFTTTPSLDGSGSLTLYSSIMFAERFTNGPYPIQNNGDQIKVTLNISLD